MNEQNQTTTPDSLINLLFDDGVHRALPRIAEILMNAAMLLEREAHIGASPYQRGVARNGYANGFKPRCFQTGIGPLNLAVPQVRQSDTVFSTSLLEKGSRSERALKSAIATMYVEGVSTRRVTKIMEELCGFEVSSGQVSNLNKQLDAEFQKWRNRLLPPIAYLTLDATYYKVRIDGVVRDCATLIAYGIKREDGKRIILGVSCALSEAEVHWRNFLSSLKLRGIGIPDLATSDAHEGLKAALKATLNGTSWQRCQFHLQQNAQQYVTKQNLKTKVAADIRIIFNATDKAHAEESLKNFVKIYSETQPKLAAWAEENLPEGFAVFSLPTEHQKRLRTSNACENVNGQIKKRTRVVGLFPNEESLLRLVTGVLIEISDSWETGKAYISLH
ncbi:MAG: IS256 family transposase [Chthoniobacteraceae bacterium]|nr:IS256 family transposase [Chthoniobacteraceae bacterium]